MSFGAKESTGGKPRECYAFQRGNRAWRYTSSRDLQTIAGVLFVPALISRGEFKRAENTGATKVAVTVGLSTPMAQAMLGAHPMPVQVTVYRIQDGDTEVTVPFVGVVHSVKVTDSGMELTLASVESRFQAPVPRTLVTRTCQNAVYDERCGLRRADWEEFVTAQSIDTAAQTITLAAIPAGGDGYYTNGLIRSSDNLDVFITSHVGAVLGYLGALPPSIFNGATIHIAPGCDKSLKMNHQRFFNSENFLGFPWLPEQNPFVTLD